MLVHAAPAKLSVEVRDDAGVTVASGDVDREGDYAPMTLLRLDGATVRRSEVWPDADDEGTVVLLAGGEAGVLRSWRHSDDRQWWQWSLELSNHKDRPADWHPPAT